MALNVATACGRCLYVLHYHVAGFDVSTAGDAVRGGVSGTLQLHLATAGNRGLYGASGQVLQVDIATAGDGAFQRTALHEVALHVTTASNGNLQVGGCEVSDINVAAAGDGQQHTAGLDAWLQLHIATSSDGHTLDVRRLYLDFQFVVGDFISFLEFYP